MLDRLREMFDPAGLPYADERIDRVPNSRRALLLAELARERGVYEPLHERLFAAYWAEARDLSRDDVLLEEAVAVGLDEQEARAAIADANGRLSVIRQETQTAISLGAGGVPAWLVDDRLLVPGAQPHELFDRVMERLGHAPLDAPG